MTSLQRAAAAAAFPGSRSPRAGANSKRKEIANTDNKNGGGGMFENSFGGLDLSEFGLPSGHGGAGRQPSAAAKLMRIKAEEARIAEREAKEEVEMSENAARLARDRTTRQLKSGDDGGGKNARGADLLGSGGFFSALVSMHGGDDVGANRERSTGSSNTLKKVKRRNVPVVKSGSAGKVSKHGISRGSASKVSRQGKGMAKKSKRTKY
uniref:Uncharacterized protein n=1 Tax=Pseudictyota dubia TaxID=2749911 RepID=A0A7R9W8M3_9STRA